MTDERIQRCIYEGRHEPVTDGFRHPLNPIIEAGIMFDVGSDKPAEIPYELIYRCRACNMEWRERPTVRR